MIDVDTMSTELKRYVVPLVILCGGVAGFFVLSSLRTPPASSTPTRLPPLVDTVVVQAGRRQLEFDVDGEVIPYREVSLSSEVAGRVMMKAPACRAGRYVRKDTVLLQIDPRDYDLEIKRLEAMVEQAAVTIDELRVERENTDSLIKLANEDLVLQRSEVKRVESLFQRRVASDSELDAARRNELTSRNTLQKLKNEILLIDARRIRLLRDKERIGTELEKAKLDRARTEIRAPIDGVVMKDDVEQDAFVSRGTMLLSIQDTSKVEVRFDLKMDELRWLWHSGSASAAAADPTAADLAAADSAASYELPDEPVTVVYDLDGNEFHWQGRLSRYDGAGMNATTRTVPCIAVVDDPRAGQPAAGARSALDSATPPALIRGMFVIVRFRVPTSQPLLVVPAATIRPGNKIWVVRDGKLSIEQANVAQTLDDQVLLLADDAVLAPGAHVVTSPIPVAVNGMPLRLRDDRPQEDAPRAATMPAGTVDDTAKTGTAR